MNKQQLYNLMEDTFDEITLNYGLNFGYAELSTFDQKNEAQWFTLEGPFGQFATGEFQYDALNVDDEDLQYEKLIQAFIDALENYDIPADNAYNANPLAEKDKTYFKHKSATLFRDLNYQPA